MREKLTYANVMSTIAVFLVLGGGFAIAAAVKKNSVRSKQVKNESLTNKDLKDSKAVGSAEVIDESLGAGDLGANSVGAAELIDPQPVHVVGAAGEPAFGNGDDGDCIWSDAAAGIPGFNPASFYRDPSGIVHLAGIPGSNNGAGGDAACDASNTQERFDDFRMYTLPTGYRPAGVEEFTTHDGNTVWIIFIGSETDTSFSGLATIRAGGVYALTNGTTSQRPGGILTSGISFRAAGPATSAAPAAQTPAPRPRNLLGIPLR
jgi:hypothetical protein